ncbi:MAG: phosphoribosyltransferase [Demequinaceae bacterium]|nr:phosphoribosyltransferase [Demequinaceae bacterium]
MEVLRDRSEAGRLLASRLAHLADVPTIVLGIPRGGVPVAAEVARALSAPLDVLLVRKLGVPGYEEYGFGAIGEGGIRVLDQAVIAANRLTLPAILAVEHEERAELVRRAALYRRGAPPPSLSGKTAILVDDGVAMGGTMRAAIAVTRAASAKYIVVAVGVAPPETLRALAALADEAHAVLTPAAFSSVGQWYRDFRQTTDAEVLHELELASRAHQGDESAGTTELR